MKKISFVIPCYRSEHTIQIVVSEIVDAMAQLTEFDYEIILISDASPDNVYQVICDLAEKNKRIIGIELSRNFGQHSALMAGYAHVTGDIVVSLDDDGQTPVDEVYKLINKIQDGYDVVFAAYPIIQQSFWRILGSKINEKMTEILLKKPKGLKLNSYFAVKRYIIEEMIGYKNPYPYIAGLVLRSTKSITNVPVKQRKRIEGNSGYTFTKLVSMWMNGFTAFSVAPLRIATILGYLVSGFSVILGLYLIVSKFMHPNVPMGYTSLMTVMLFTTGIIMILLGLIGEYLGRIYICINQAPQYVVKNTTKRTVDGENYYGKFDTENS